VSAFSDEKFRSLLGSSSGVVVVAIFMFMPAIRCPFTLSAACVRVEMFESIQFYLTAKNPFHQPKAVTTTSARDSTTALSEQIATACSSQMHLHGGSTVRVHWGGRESTNVHVPSFGPESCTGRTSSGEANVFPQTNGFIR